MTIRAALGLSPQTYARWAKAGGFRQGDLHPQAHRPGAHLSTPAGPGGSARSCRYRKGEGLAPDHPAAQSGAGHPAWRGGVAASRARYGERRDGQRDKAEAEVAERPAAELYLDVLNHLANGDAARADRLMRAWRALQRRQAWLKTLKQAAYDNIHQRQRAAGILRWQDARSLQDLAQLSEAELERYVCHLIPGLAQADGGGPQAGETKRPPQKERPS